MRQFLNGLPVFRDETRLAGIALALGANIGTAVTSALMGVLSAKSTKAVRASQLLARKAMRLTVDDPDYLNLVRLETPFVDQTRRIYTLAKCIAKVVLPPVLAQRN